ncbi:MAG: 4-hydroxybenzoate octaprenyltransferase [Rhodospirillaceae bacterium]|nr:4-hydroxybenzoate octaprenyltransferase [Rhodospirillaceae bacterium]
MKETGTLLGDIPVGSWINRLSPSGARPYLRLMRLDRPIGTWLLLFPCWWSIAMAATEGGPDLRLMILFALGAVVMRGAGCTFNDIVDRDYDGLVERTAHRPIPAGEVSTTQAALFLILLLFLGLLILLQLGTLAIGLGAVSLLLVFTYPFMKRVTYWPQAWLGLTFNWGAILGWAAATGGLNAVPLTLYAAGFFWTLGYDTIYAHQDKQDDAVIGLKSSALRLGSATPGWMIGFYTLTLAGIAAAGVLAELHWVFYPILALAGIHLFWQIRTLDIDHPGNCLRRFRSNRWFGWLVLAAIIAGRLW